MELKLLATRKSVSSRLSSTSRFFSNVDLRHIMSSAKTIPSAMIASSASAPIVVSPIAVSQRAKATALHTSSGTEQEQHNWMRQQWIANLKKMQEKKRLAAANSTTEPFLANETHPIPVVVNNLAPTAEFRKPKKINSKKSNSKRNSKKNELLMEEMEGPNSDGMRKKWVKRLLKKRGNQNIQSISNPNAPKPRTPRRKLNSGQSFEDFETQSFSSSSSFCSSPNTTSDADFNMWSARDTSYVTSDSEPATSELDFDIDTTSLDSFLELSSPRPTGTRPTGNDIPKPCLVRTSSLEQDGLSHFLEQTRITPRTREVDSWFSQQSKPDPDLKSFMEDYKLTDIDKELDNFYLENITSFDNDFGM